MPRQARAQPFGKYHAELSRILRQMGDDPRIPDEVSGHVLAAINGVSQLMLSRHVEPVPVPKPKRGPR